MSESKPSHTEYIAIVHSFFVISHKNSLFTYLEKPHFHISYSKKTLEKDSR